MFCLTSGVDGDIVDDVFPTKIDCPVGIDVHHVGVNTVVFDVDCAGIVIDGRAAVISE